MNETIKIAIEDGGYVSYGHANVQARNISQGGLYDWTYEASYDGGATWATGYLKCPMLDREYWKALGIALGWAEGEWLEKAVAHIQDFLSEGKGPAEKTHEENVAADLHRKNEPK